MGVVTVRLPDAMHQAIRITAENHSTSMNDLFCLMVDRYIKEEQEKELYEGFGVLGSDHQESNVEYAFSAQAEVALKDE